VWVDPAAVDGATDSYLQQYLRIDDPDAVDAFVTDVLATDEVGTADWRDTRADTLEINQFFSAFIGGFAVFVMIAAAVVVAGAISARVVARRRNLGLLKAAGITPRQVTAMILMTYASLAALAAVLGWLLGGWMSGPLQLTVAEVLGHSGASFPVRSLLIAVVVVEAIVTLAAIVPAWRSGRMSTSAALSPIVARRRRRSLLGALVRRSGGGPVAALAARSATGRRGRAVLTVVALTIGVIAATVTAGFEATLDRIVDRPALVGAPQDVDVGLEGADPAAVIAAIREVPGVASVVALYFERATVGDTAFLVKGLGGDIADVGFELGEGRLPTGTGEATAGYGLLRLLGVDVGDTLRMTFGDRTVDVEIVGWYHEGEDAGEVLLVPHWMLGDLAPDDVYVNAESGVEAVDLAMAVDAALGDGVRVEPLDVELGDEFLAFRLAFSLVTGLALLLAMANLSATMLLAVRERAHDLGVLRSIGLTPRQAASVSGGAAGVLALAAAAIGLALGWMASRALGEGVAAGAGWGPGTTADPAMWTVAATCAVTIAIAVGLGLLFARRHATMPVGELVRYE
jgi:putative ABC transport system permease protein